MNRPRSIAAAAALLFSAALLLRVCGPTPVATPRCVELPPLPIAPAPKPVPMGVSPSPPSPVAPERLRPFLERLGRARLLRDRRILQSLLRDVPPLFESDAAWVYARLEGDLFAAAGAAELAAIYGLRGAVPYLAAALSRPSHAFLKDVLIDSLAALGGDAAESALLVAVRHDADDSIRMRCAGALAGFDGPEVYRTLIDALRDPILRVRAAASAALARMKSGDVVRVLMDALREEREPAAQAELIVSIHAAGGPVAPALSEHPAAAELLRARSRAHGDARYRRPYDRVFFEPGAATLPFDPTKRRIGITVDLGAGVGLRDVALALFGAAPLDRTRDWFYFRRAADFPEPKAFDSHGDPMEALPYGDLDGTVVLHFKDPGVFDKGVLGYTTGCHAFVQGASLLHEFGHAFARLGDEYEDGSAHEAANLFQRETAPWMTLVESGLLPAPLRRDARFFMPSDNCYLNNRATQSRYCPVCQLEIHARIAELTGAPLPW